MAFVKLTRYMNLVKVGAFFAKMECMCAGACVCVCPQSTVGRTVTVMYCVSILDYYLKDKLDISFFRKGLPSVIAPTLRFFL